GGRRLAARRGQHSPQPHAGPSRALQPGTRPQLPGHVRRRRSAARRALAGSARRADRARPGGPQRRRARRLAPARPLPRPPPPLAFVPPNRLVAVSARKARAGPWLSRTFTREESMRMSRYVAPVVVLLAALAIAAPAVAQDAESLRKELEQMRKQLQDVQQ